MVKHVFRLPGEADLIDELSGQQIVNDRFNAQRGQPVAEFRNAGAGRESF